MKICIYGAGAIGGHLGVLLAAAGADVTLIARGAHLAAMRQNGLRLLSGKDDRVVRLNCTDDPHEAGPQDYIILTLKTHAVGEIAAGLHPMMSPATTVVTAMNGVPFWYFFRQGGRWDGHRLESVDPGGRQWDAIGPERALGCVVWTSGEIVAPGVIRHEHGNRMPLGEPGGSRSDRALALSKIMTAAGLKAPVRPRIRSEIWIKLWGNLAFNPVSVLTHANLVTLATSPNTQPVIRALMEEARAVGQRLGIDFAVDVDERMRMAAEVGAHKTSMLQDLELGRPMEIDAIVGAVAEMGRLTGVATPTIDLIHGLTIQRAREAGCYPQA
ncbi:MAG: 2-dehydropantoate 2-reductase [Alphaproteobacteria bacterium]|nr:2-dehydropantoate 2-reductase [Alphaproteobacteria bacterium]